MTTTADTPHAPQETAPDVGGGSIRPAPTVATAVPSAPPPENDRKRPDLESSSTIDFLTAVNALADRANETENLFAAHIEKLQTAVAAAWQKIVALESAAAALERRVAEFSRHANL